MVAKVCGGISRACGEHVCFALTDDPWIPDRRCQHISLGVLDADTGAICHDSP
jgi:hypothetical protein